MCGVGFIADLTGERNVVPQAVVIAEGLQPRGDVSFGIATFRNILAVPFCGNGLVKQVVTPNRLPFLDGKSVLVHNRYATSGDGNRSEIYAQPFGHTHEDPSKRFVFGFNGNIANYEAKRDELVKKGVDMGRHVDTELILQLIIQEIHTQVRTDVAAVFTMLEDQLDGAFTIAWFNELNEAAIYRSANGIKPMSYAVHDGLIAAASEDSALQLALPHCSPEDLEPGQLLHINNGNWDIKQIANETRSRCFFESVYFAKASSTLDGQNVQADRFTMGRMLAQDETEIFEDAVIVPVPDSAISAADGYAMESNWHLATGLNKQPNIGRTFTADKETRAIKVKNKYKIHPSLMEDKDVILVDDSIVRGTTMRILAQQIREKAKPSSIHLRIASPPILAPCFYGIDFPTCQELIARKYAQTDLQTGHLPADVLAAIATDLNVNSIQFLSVEQTKATLDRENNGLCMACVTGNYPTKSGQERYQLELHKN